MPTVSSGPAVLTLLARLATLALALGWAVLFFGLIDLSVSVAPSMYAPEFAPYVVVEASWGLLYTLLVPVPLVAWAVRPSPWPAWQLAAVAGTVLVAGAVFGVVGHLAVAAVLAVCALVVWRRPRGSLAWGQTAGRRRPGSRQAAAPLAAWVAVGVAAAAVHVVDLRAAVEAGVDDDNTWNLMHLPMQGAFALAVPVAAGVAGVALVRRARGWQLAFVPPTLSAVWFGVVCAVNPDLVGSVGTVAGWLTAAWGVTLPGTVSWLHRHLGAAERTSAVGDRGAASSRSR